MEQKVAGEKDSEAASNANEEQQARQREALRRRVHESLLRCPGAEPPRPA